MVERVTIESPNGLLAGVVHLPKRTPAPVIICSHGLLSSKDGSKFVALGEEFASLGWAALRFDFAGCGASAALPQRELVPSRLSDLKAVVEFALRASWSRGPLGLLGSSMGGYISLLAAARLGVEIRGVVCWATPYDLREIHPDATRLESLEQFFPRGFELGKPHNLEDLPAVSGCLVVHGQLDEIVPWGHAVKIFDRLAEPRQSCLMSTADHRISDPQWRSMAISMSQSWFQKLVFSRATQREVRSVPDLPQVFSGEESGL